LSPSHAQGKASDVLKRAERKTIVEKSSFLALSLLKGPAEKRARWVHHEMRTYLLAASLISLSR